VRRVKFYRTKDGDSPIDEFLDTLSSKHAQKITWVLRLIEELEIIPITYFKKMVGTEDLWEIRVQSGNNAYRLLGFQYIGNFIVLTNGFHKKTRKTPKSEISLAERRKKDWLRRKT
jgi:phage-related protein